MTIEEKYQILCATPSDINLHLPTLRQYADRVDHVTEFGTRACVSLHAFLASKAKTVVAYDIQNVAVPADCPKLTFINADVLTVEIEPTDMLFVDSYHTAGQLSQELTLHANKVRRYLAFHDTAIFGERGEDGGPGLMAALLKFMADEPLWNECYYSSANNGLTILERV